MTTRQDSLDQLLNITIPGVSTDEFINVDSFFDSYVAELSQRSKRQGDDALLTRDAKHVRRDAPPAFPSSSNPPSLSGGPGVSAFALASYPSTDAPDTSPTGKKGGHQQTVSEQPSSLLQLQWQQLQNAGLLPPMPTSTMQNPSGANFNLDGLMTHAREDNGSEQLGEQRSGSPDPPGASDRKTPATAKAAKAAANRQQEANKAAQQRYRERKKQKFAELERTVETLQQQLASLQALQQRNEILEGMNTQLQSTLVDKERELERIKVALDAQADESLAVGGAACGADSGNRHPQSVEGDGEETGRLGRQQQPLPTDEACGGVQCDVLPRDLANIDFKAGFDDQIELLKMFMKEHGLRKDEDYSDATDLSPNILRNLAQLVGRACQLCQAAIRSEGVRVLELITRDPAQLSSMDSGERTPWQAALEVMRLNQDQIEQLLLLRRAHLEKMRTVYAERQSLNLEAMALMLPHHSRDPAEDNTLEGRMANMATQGYLSVAKSNAELTQVLDRIKDNLRREQRYVMDLNCCTISRILTPLQAARYMITVYPRHCDALALSNVLATSLGRSGSGEGSGGVAQGHCGPLGNTASVTCSGAVGARGCC